MLGGYIVCTAPLQLQLDAEVSWIQARSMSDGIDLSHYARLQVCLPCSLTTATAIATTNNNNLSEPASLLLRAFSVVQHAVQTTLARWTPMFYSKHSISPHCIPCLYWEPPFGDVMHSTLTLTRSLTHGLRTASTTSPTRVPQLCARPWRKEGPPN